mmetsp:Transcript_17898/g.50681  ORF Transcript_17898/g.50681 Transcript_17898/m.50681 type:complete len:222 (+) Transcript_17898:155-820(+)
MTFGLSFTARSSSSSTSSTSTVGASAGAALASKPPTAAPRAESCSSPRFWTRSASSVNSGCMPCMPPTRNAFCTSLRLPPMAVTWSLVSVFARVAVNSGSRRASPFSLELRAVCCQGSRRAARAASCALLSPAAMVVSISWPSVGFWSKKSADAVSWASCTHIPNAGDMAILRPSISSCPTFRFLHGLQSVMLLACCTWRQIPDRSSSRRTLPSPYFRIFE